MKLFNALAATLSLLGVVGLSPAGAENLPSANAAFSAAQLASEFSGSYAETAPASQHTETVELTAAPGEWGIVPPYRTAVWSYNGTVDPVLRIKLGDTLKVLLHNKLPQPTTLHWHGVRVPNAMDGVPEVTQPAVKPGESFTYEFTPKDAGTFWFHPHVNAAEQIERGLQGMLIVEDPHAPAYSQDLAWVLDDWLLEKGAKIYEEFVTGHDLMHDGRWGNVSTVNGRYQPTIPVKAGERLRIRMVNAANGRVFLPALAELEPRIIAVDGMPVQQPRPMGGFYMAPGNRLDVDVSIPLNAAGKTLTLTDGFGKTPNPLAYLQVAAKPAVKTPSFAVPQAAHFPQWQTAMAAPLTHEFLLNAVRGGEHGITWTIDGQSGHAHTALTMQAGHFYRLRFTNQSYRLHPMHLHGQFFRVLAVDGQPVMENVWRDTVLIGPKQSLDIGLVPLDKGVWALHCHILEHAEAGMMATVRVD